MTPVKEETDYQIAIKKIGHLKEESRHLYDTACYAISLVLGGHLTLKGSIKKAKEERAYPVAAQIERAVRTAIPEEYFLQRQRNYKEAHFPRKD